MLSIGLTGGIGAGKSAATLAFRKLNVPVIDADSIASQLRELHAQAIQTHFGSAVNDASLQLDTNKLRQLVFTDAKAKRWLEQFLHPRIRSEIKSQLASLSAPYAIVVVPLLFETHFEIFLDRVLVIDTSIEQQIDRIKEREYPPEVIANIIQSQLKREVRLSMADDVIENNSSLADLENAVQQMHAFYLQLANGS